MTPRDAVFVCVAENVPRFHRQIRYLLHSIRTYGGSLRDARVVVAFVDDVRPEYREDVIALGGEVEVVPRIDEGPPPANKLRALEVVGGDHESLIAIDCDTIVTGDLGPLVGDAIKAKASDTNEMTTDWWLRLYKAVDLTPPADWIAPTTGGERKPAQYNSGVVFYPGEVVRGFRERWFAEMVRLSSVTARRPWLMPRGFRFFNEQIAFCFTVQRHGYPFELLPLTANFPTHVDVADDLLAEDERPQVLHYHRAVDSDGFLARPVEPRVAALADEANRSIAERFGLAYEGLKDPIPKEPVPPLPIRAVRKLSRAVRPQGG